MNPTRWNHVKTPRGTVFRAVVEMLATMDAKYPASLPSVRSGATIFIGTDFSGEHRGAPYVVYSILLTTAESWQGWEGERNRIRKELFPTGRRMSFKRLGDRQRARVLVPFLTAANELDGLVFLLAISKECSSLFAASPPLDLGNPDFSAYRKWKPRVLDKAFVVLHLTGLLLAGLAGRGQNVVWLTDEDDIAANDQRLAELTELFTWVCGLYLTFQMGHCRCGTSRCDNGTLQVEDFLAIPDLIAGALSEQLTASSNDPEELAGVFWMHRGDLSEKARAITWWFSDASQPLKRLVAVVDPSDSGTGHTVSWYHFYNQCPN